MKTISIVTLVFGIVFASTIDEQCIGWANKTVSIDSCCKLTPIFSYEIKSLALEELPKNVPENSTIYFCHITQKFFEKANVTSFEQSSMRNYFEKAILDQDWLTIMKNASDHCIESGLKHAEAAQLKLNVGKEECDARFLYFFECFVYYTKLVRDRSFLDEDV
ncbi:hypothetical protein ACKWTF_013039 [Chironomus riparius]